MTTNLLPHAVIGGAPRSGTTFLCEVLDKHPGIFVAKPFIPERKVLMLPNSQGDAGYREIYREIFAEAPPTTVRVEKTSYYLENADARARFTHLLPQTKMIFILRDPIRRAYSNWLWSRKNGLETMSFADAVALEPHRPNPLPLEKAYARPFDYITRGNYGSFADLWIKAVGRSRIGFFMFDTVNQDPETFCKELQTFLGVEPLPWSRLMTSAVNAFDAYEPELSAELMSSLRQKFAPEMLRLNALTGLDVGHWGY